MSLRIYIWSLIVFMLLTLVGWLFVLFNVDPFESGLIGQVLFFLSFYLFLFGFFTNILVWLRAKFLGDETALENMNLSFRQGFLLALLVTIIIVLNVFGFLVWWTGLLVMAGIFLIEFFFLIGS